MDNHFVARHVAERRNTLEPFSWHYVAEVGSDSTSATLPEKLRTNILGLDVAHRFDWCRGFAFSPKETRDHTTIAKIKFTHVQGGEK